MELFVKKKPAEIISAGPFVLNTKTKRQRERRNKRKLMGKCKSSLYSNN